MRKCLCLLIVLLLFDCKSSTKEFSYVSMLDKIQDITGKDMDHYNAILVIPFYGCVGCISSAERFLLQDYINGGKKGMFFIVTGHDSEKSARLRLGDLAISHPDVYIDIKDDFDDYVAQFPIMIELNEGEIAKISEANLDNQEIYTGILQ